MNNKIKKNQTTFIKSNSLKSDFNTFIHCKNGIDKKEKNNLHTKSSKKFDSSKNAILKLHKSKRLLKNKNFEKNIVKELQDYNQSPFTKVLREDHRNICELIKSFILEKIEILHIITSPKYFIEIKISEYSLSLLIDFFFNILFYSDEIVSKKYHNNGKLDFVITLLLSIVSNIFSSIIMYYLVYSETFEERLEDVKEIKKENKYLYALKKFLKYIKLKIMVFIIINIIIISFCFYYIAIFCIIYNKTQRSL